MKIIAKNKKAFYDYEILEQYEAGIMLEGPEVKGIKAGQISIKESFISIGDKSLTLKNSLITIPSYAKQYSADEKRDKKLLLNKKELKDLKTDVERKGYTIVPLEVYVNDKGLIKIKIALAKGKKEYEKRDTIKKRESERKIKEEY